MLLSNQPSAQPTTATVLASADAPQNAVTDLWEGALTNPWIWAVFGLLFVVSLASSVRGD